MPPTKSSLVAFFDVFGDALFGPLLEPPKIYVDRPQEGSWSQHVRFGTPTWPPKRSQNRCFWRLKLDFMLRRPKMVKLVPLWYENTIFRGPPPPQTVPKSIKNRSQEPSMLRPVFSTRQNRLWGPPGAILRRFFNIK